MKDIFYYVFTDKNIDKQVESGKIYKIFKQYILDNNIKMYDVSTIYYPKEIKKEFDTSKNINITIDKIHYKNVLINSLHLDNFRSKVTNTQDIIKYFNY